MAEATPTPEALAGRTRRAAAAAADAGRALGLVDGLASLVEAWRQSPPFRG